MVINDTFIYANMSQGIIFKVKASIASAPFIQHRLVDNKITWRVLLLLLAMQMRCVTGGFYM